MKYNAVGELYNKHQIPFDKDTEYYVIGDVHGCANEYNKLMDIIWNDCYNVLRRKYIVVIQLGDMIDRGPEFERVILEDQSDYRCMGNHEANFIVENYGYKPCSSNERKINHARFAESKNQQRILDSLLDRKSFFWMIDDSGIQHVFSHAPITNIEAGWKGIDLLGSTTVADFCMRSKPIDLEKLIENNEDIVFYYGHQSWSYVDICEQIESQNGSNVQAFNLDSGCVYGEELIAFRVKDQRVFRVKSETKVAR